MIISEKQILFLMTQLKNHIDLVLKMNGRDDKYFQHLIDLYEDIVKQQSDELKEISNEESVTQKSCENVVTECQHENDGEVYIVQLADGSERSVMYKCIKCGEFYR